MSAMPKRKAAAQAVLATKSQLAPRAAAAAVAGTAKAASSAPRPRLGPWDTSSLSSLSDLSDLEPDPVAPAGASLPAPPLSAAAVPAPALPAGPAQRKRKASGQDAGAKRSPKRAKKQQQQPAPESPKLPHAEEAPMPVRPVGDVWSLMFLIMERYAFVRLDQDGNPTDGSKESSAAPGYWWPSKILSETCKPPIEVQLFGDDGHGAARHFELHAPSEFNIVTTRRNTATTARRFHQATFASPPNRFGNLCSKWSLAMDEYSNDIMGDDSLGQQHVSPLPMPVPGASSQSSTPARKRAQPKPRKARAGRTLDTTIRLPGERVLARKKDSTTTSLHWPALVQQFQSKGTKYQLLFHDDTEQWVAREYFHLRHEDGFAQCNVDMELWGLEERDREFDDDDDDVPFAIPARDKGMPSPPPELPSLPLCGDGSDYRGLPIRAQVALVEHVLDLIINDKYSPARRRHRDFIKGRRAREMLAQTAGAKGSLTVDEQTQIREIVRKWALRDERWAKHIDDFGDVDGEDADDEAPPMAARLPSPSPAAAVQEPATASPPRPSSLPPPGEPEAAAQEDSMDVDPDVISAVEDVDLDMRAMDDVLDLDSVFAAPAPPAVVQTFTGVMRSPTESAMHSPDLRYMPSLAPTQPSTYGALGLAFGSDSASQPGPGPSSIPDDSGATMAVDAEEAATSMAVDVAVAAEEPAPATQDAPAPAVDETAAPVGGEDVAMPDSTAPIEATVACDPTATDAQTAAAEDSSEPSAHAIAAPADESTIAPPPVDAADATLPVASPTAPVDDTALPTASPLTIAANIALPPSSQPASVLGASSPPPTQPVSDSPFSQADNSSPAPQAAELDASSPADRGSETAASDSASGSETHVGQPTPSERVPHRRGCATYEALSESERNQYCIDVLAYEAVVQVLLWRSGKKIAVEPLEDDAAEAALHEEGITLANTYDHKLWVYEIADRRRKKDQMKPPLLKRETFSGKELRSAHKVNYREDD